ncbi:hypothetical protein [Haliscomenobacter hydrossis]|uniref:Uncharacterized protein n=1 Tax=Haliscomenobacter hydrossis (strain ATCC 27775 / DSM 1100 / LMG 10767 / O) TaxID=760192 RepID=F4L5P5_HALH1|nr:hypothetical protein [Haliscomenobacter hydrossis]AEE51880.1 hypothetical protein Halhy_4032 [Haliscomenobacter hydrossis DSM 1100]
MRLADLRQNKAVLTDVNSLEVFGRFQGLKKLTHSKSDDLLWYVIAQFSQALRQVSRMIILLKTIKPHKSCMQDDFFFAPKPQ